MIAIVLTLLIIIVRSSFGLSLSGNSRLSIRVWSLALGFCVLK